MVIYDLIPKGLGFPESGLYWQILPLLEAAQLSGKMMKAKATINFDE
ncbi:hypothetical protein MC7420_1372 [Coleofasciculus chthonoplastes PCC 7420]|uniref:Uncharacterized protein n=1 Tax=Coleofasciculus chthonoplastes PCC 7420 TaxID=118168 RepID=B4VRS4_9CYAN|nr:hypothetical protein MC7420_1372 [Coleofasciculus chthonoplastes PCC 7420]